MNKKLHPLIFERLKHLNAKSSTEAMQFAKEMLQEFALLGLYRIGFFKKVAFHGGTAFRIFYGLDRFSEDLDFCLMNSDPHFSLSTMLSALKSEIEAWGFEIEVLDREKDNQIVKTAFIKETSLGVILRLSNPLGTKLNPKQKLTIKLEVDSNPPQGANFEAKLSEFPLDFYVVCHDLPSMFSGKLHAILNRSYLKGRDWYDLLEYFNRRTKVNFNFLKNALLQKPDPPLLPSELDADWLSEVLTNKIKSIDFVKAKNDVFPFVRHAEKLEHWSSKYFLDKFERYLLETYTLVKG